MSKQEFLTQLRKALSGLPQNDIEERIEFYSEMIEDRIDEGLSEGEAIAAVGTVEELNEKAGNNDFETTFVSIVKGETV